MSMALEFEKGGRAHAPLLPPTMIDILSTLLLTLVSVTVYLLKKDTLDYNNIIDTV